MYGQVVTSPRMGQPHTNTYGSATHSFFILSIQTPFKWINLIKITASNFLLEFLILSNRKDRELRKNRKGWAHPLSTKIVRITKKSSGHKKVVCWTPKNRKELPERWDSKSYKVYWLERQNFPVIVLWFIPKFWSLNLSRIIFTKTKDRKWLKCKQTFWPSRGQGKEAY